VLFETKSTKATLYVRFVDFVLHSRNEPHVERAWRLSRKGWPLGGVFE
jgi:hypothetical protein